MRTRLILGSVLTAILLWSAEVSAATRVITGTLYRPNDTVWAGGTLTIQLLETFSNVGQTVVPQMWRATANAIGVVTVTILVPDVGAARYRFMLPDGSEVDVTLGVGATVLLETIFTTGLTDPTAETTLADMLAAMSFTATGTGAVARTVTSRLLETISVKDFGAVGDGVTDDTAAIQAALNAAYTTGTRGRTVFIPGGDYKVTATLTINDVYGLVLYGAGYQTRLIWYGATNTGPLLKLTNTHSSRFHNFLIQSGGASNVLSVGIWMFTAAGARTFNSRYNRFENILLDGGTTNLTTGVRIGGSTSTEGVSDSNNDFHQFDHVNIANHTGDAFSLENSQIYNISFFDCLISAAAGATASAVTTLLGGNFMWFGGGGAVRDGTFFIIGALGNASVLIQGADVESSARLLTTGGPSGGTYKHIIIAGSAFRSNSLHADGIAIQVQYAGALSVRNSLIGSDTTKALKFALGAGSNPQLFGFSGNTIKASSVTIAALFPTGVVPSVLEGNVGQDAGGFSLIGGTPITTTGISLGTTLAFSSTTPVYSSGFGTGRTFTGTAVAFRINVGTGGSATGGVFTLPAATTGWNCAVQNITAYAANRPDQRTVQTADTTTTVTIQNQTISTGAALAWTASDIVKGQCAAY